MVIIYNIGYRKYEATLTYIYVYLFYQILCIIRILCGAREPRWHSFKQSQAEDFYSITYLVTFLSSETSFAKRTQAIDMIDKPSRTYVRIQG